MVLPPSNRIDPKERAQSERAQSERFFLKIWNQSWYKFGTFLFIFWLCSPYLILVLNTPFKEFFPGLGSLISSLVSFSTSPLSSPSISPLTPTKISSSYDFYELFWSLKNSFFQAIGSSFLAFFLGIWLWSGVSWIFKKKIISSPTFLRLIKFSCWFFLLLPSFLPSIYILLIFLSIIQPFPIGNWGVILIQGISSAGIFAFAWGQIITNRALGMLDLCVIEGANKWSVYKVLFGAFKKEIIILNLFVFINAFTSFSIPLIIGGGFGSNLEVLIYEKVLWSKNLGEAIWIALLQMLFIFLFSIFLRASAKIEWTLGLSNSDSAHSKIGSFFGFLVLISYSFFFFFSFIFLALSGWSQVFQIPGLWSFAFTTISRTFLMGLLGGLIIYFLLLFTVFALPRRILDTFLVNYTAPSTALIGLSFYLLPGYSIPFILLKFYSAFLILIFTSIYRLGWHQTQESLAAQVQIAQTLGAPQRLLFRKIIFPQVSPLAAHLASLGSLWLMSDFALSKILLGQNLTLSLVIESLMTSYRFDAACALSGLLLLVCASVYLIILRFEYVMRRKFIQEI